MMVNKELTTSFLQKRDMCRWTLAINGGLTVRTDGKTHAGGGMRSPVGPGKNENTRAFPTAEGGLVYGRLGRDGWVFLTADELLERGLSVNLGS
jgi:hypothetical protein